MATVLVSCTDRPAPTEVARPYSRSAKAAAGTCTTIPQLKTLATTVFGSRNQFLHDALDNISDIGEYVAENHIADAQKKAKSLTAYIQKHASSLANPSQSQTLIDAILCYAGLTTDTFLVFPSDQPQEIVTSNGQAGIQLQANPVTEPTLITVTLLTAADSGVLDTKLDKYPGFIEIQQLSGTGNSLAPGKQVIVAVCPSATIPADVRSRLRLGHQSAIHGFEITQYADASFLSCSGIASIESKLPGWVGRLASLVLPKPLYARMRFSGGVGGTAEEFSPFGPVDTQVDFSGGVGGTATEFQRAPAPSVPGKNAPEAAKKPAPHLMSSTESAVAFQNAVICDQATVGSAIPADCRPLITLRTHNGTILQNVPVTWAIGLGGGQLAADNAAGVVPDCGVFGTTASTTTNITGHTRVCWTLGAEAGTNTLIATPHTGGDVPAGTTFSPATNTFTATALKALASISLGGFSQMYDGNPKSVTVTTTPGGLDTVNVTYNGLPTVPTAGGSYTVVATLNNPSYEGMATGTLVITRAPQLGLSVTGPGTATFGDLPVQLTATGGSTSGGALTFDATGSTACSVSLAGMLSIISGTGTCAITATNAGDANYGPVTSAAFTITIGKAAQATLSFTGAAPVAFGGSAVTLTADGGSGSGAVTFSAAGSTACTVTTVGAVTATAGTGTCDISVTKAADDNYLAATSTTVSLTVTKASQAPLSVSASGTATFGDASVLLATSGGSGTGSVTFDATGSTACTVSPAGMLSIISGTGTCAITATNAGDTNYDPITSTAFTITINKASQGSLAVTGPPTATYGGGTITLGTTGGLSSGSVLYDASTTPGACSVNATSGVLSISIGTGSCVVTATKGGDANYNPVTSGALIIALSKAGQSISFTAPPSATYGDPSLTLTANATSGLPVAYSVGAGSNCTISGSTVSLTGAGSCVLTASQGGDANFYNGASPVTQSVSIAKRGATATAGTGSMPTGGTVPSLPCTVSGLLAADAGTITCTTSVPATLVSGANTTSPVISPLIPANYAMSSVNGTLTLTGYVQQGCFASPISNSVTPPSTATGVSKGTKVTVKCRLVDRGTNGLALPPGATVFSGTNVFTVHDDHDYSDDDGIYTYSLATTSFTKGRYYLVTATWNDGSTTKGWIYIKP
ncbi:MAG: MBG domain-containing protein [Gemmatimonadetes bacterium]|nr:MBG domain-containing protein [Gemmatimonadota bacterium]